MVYSFLIFVITNAFKGSRLSSLIAAAITATFMASAPAAGFALTGAAAAGAAWGLAGTFFSKSKITFDTTITKIAKKIRDKNTMPSPSNDDNKLVTKLI